MTFDVTDLIFCLAQDDSRFASKFPPHLISLSLEDNSTQYAMHSVLFIILIVLINSLDTDIYGCIVVNYSNNCLVFFGKLLLRPR